MSVIVRSQTNLATSTDGTPNVYAMHNAKPLAGTQINSSTTTRYYNVADERTSLRSSFTDTGTAGDTSQQTRYGEYKVIDSTSIAYNFYGPVGTKQSELFRVRTVSITENTVALPSEQGNLEVGGVNITFEGTRVKSALVGRDLNPIGRGDGVYYYAGAMALGVAPATPGGSGRGIGTGNSVNNCGQMGMPLPEMPTGNEFMMDFAELIGFEAFMRVMENIIMNPKYPNNKPWDDFVGYENQIMPADVPPGMIPDGEEPELDKSRLIGAGYYGDYDSGPCSKPLPPNEKPVLRAVGCCAKPCCVDKEGKSLKTLCGPADEICCGLDETFCGRTDKGAVVRSNYCKNPILRKQIGKCKNCDQNVVKGATSSLIGDLILTGLAFLAPEIFGLLSLFFTAKSLISDIKNSKSFFSKGRNLQSKRVINYRNNKVLSPLYRSRMSYLYGVISAVLGVIFLIAGLIKSCYSFISTIQTYGKCSSQDACDCSRFCGFLSGLC